MIAEEIMEKTVFILGAGASKQAGAPLMSDFLDVGHNQWKLGRTGEDANSFETVFKAVALLQDVHSKSELDINNVESVFTALEMAKILNRFPRSDAKQIDGMIQAMRKVIARTLELTVRFPVQHGSILSPQPYDDFVKLFDYLKRYAQPAHSITILTFNYDIAIDFALSVGGNQVNYGFNNESTLPLLKLHGSLNWTTVKGVDAIFPYQVNDFLRKRRLQVGREVQTVTIEMVKSLLELNTVERTVTGEPLIVPPTWNKGDSHRTLSGIWSLAAKALSEAENIFVIGYSLPPSDAFFRYLYALGTASDVLLKKFWVFDPASNEVEARFRSLLGSGARERFKYFRNGFAEAIEIIQKSFPANR